MVLCAAVLCVWCRELCASGYLDFAVYGATAEQNHEDNTTECESMRLMFSGVSMQGSSRVKGRDGEMLVVIANYAFDSFPGNNPLR
jgi:hypothetical protein